MYYVQIRLQKSLSLPTLSVSSEAVARRVAVSLVKSNNEVHLYQADDDGVFIKLLDIYTVYQQGATLVGGGLPLLNPDPDAGGTDD